MRVGRGDPSPTCRPSGHARRRSRKEPRGKSRYQPSFLSSPLTPGSPGTWWSSCSDPPCRREIKGSVLFRRKRAPEETCLFHNLRSCDNISLSGRKGPLTEGRFRVSVEVGSVPDGRYSSSRNGPSTASTVTRQYLASELPSRTSGGGGRPLFVTHVSSTTKGRRVTGVTGRTNNETDTLESGTQKTRDTISPDRRGSPEHLGLHISRPPRFPPFHGVPPLVSLTPLVSPPLLCSGEISPGRKSLED